MYRVTKAMYDEIKNKVYNVYWFNRATLRREKGILNCNIVSAAEEIMAGQQQGFYTVLVPEDRIQEVEALESNISSLQGVTMTYDECLNALK